MPEKHEALFKALAKVGSPLVDDLRGRFGGDLCLKRKHRSFGSSGVVGRAFLEGAVGFGACYGRLRGAQKNEVELCFQSRGS